MSNCLLSSQFISFCVWMCDYTMSVMQSRSGDSVLLMELCTEGSLQKMLSQPEHVFGLRQTLFISFFIQFGPYTLCIASLCMGLSYVYAADLACLLVGVRRGDDDAVLASGGWTIVDA